MLLTLPVVGQDPGPDWATLLYNALNNAVDAHNHSGGQGVQIQPTGLNINAALNIQQNNLYNVGSVIFGTTPASPANTSVYVSGVDLYYKDGNGNAVQLTASGSVNATSSGIASGTATASFVSSTLVVNAAANTPANIQVASVLLGNNSAGTHYLTLAPPAAMAANYGLVLPGLPMATSFMQLDTSGNMSATVPVAQGITASNIANGTITGTQIGTNAIFPSNLPASNVAEENYNVASTATSFTPLGGSLTITASGSRPLLFYIQPAAGSSLAEITIFQSGVGSVFCTGDVQLSEPGFITIATSRILSGTTGGSGQNNIATTPNIFWILDTVTAGSHTYTLSVRSSVSSGTPTFQFNNCVFGVREL